MARQVKIQGCVCQILNRDLPFCPVSSVCGRGRTSEWYIGTKWAVYSQQVTGRECIALG